MTWGKGDYDMLSGRLCDINESLESIADSLAELVEQGKPKWIELTRGKTVSGKSIKYNVMISEIFAWADGLIIGLNEHFPVMETADEITAKIAALESAKDGGE